MSLKDLFTKEGRKERALQKNCAKAADKKIKPEDRGPALYELYQVATEDEDESHRERAVLALLSRFTYIYDTNMVRDEEEKNSVYEWLLGLGERILPQVQRHLATAPTLSWGLRMVTEICDHEVTWTVLAEVLKSYTPEYERDPTRKIQLMGFLGDFKDPRSVEALLPYLGDHDETVRYVTVESLFKQGDEQAREPLLELLISEEEESLRIKNRIVEGMEQTGWRVKGFRGTVEKLLASHISDFIVDAKGNIKRKKPRQ